MELLSYSFPNETEALNSMCGTSENNNQGLYVYIFFRDLKIRWWSFGTSICVFFCPIVVSFANQRCRLFEALEKPVSRNTALNFFKLHMYCKWQWLLSHHLQVSENTLVEPTLCFACVSQTTLRVSLFPSCFTSKVAYYAFNKLIFRVS